MLTSCPHLATGLSAARRHRSVISCRTYSVIFSSQRCDDIWSAPDVCLRRSACKLVRSSVQQLLHRGETPSDSIRWLSSCLTKRLLKSSSLAEPTLTNVTTYL